MGKLTKALLCSILIVGGSVLITTVVAITTSFDEMQIRIVLALSFIILVSIVSFFFARKPESVLSPELEEKIEQIARDAARKTF